MNCSCLNYISRGTATAPPSITTAEALRYSSLPTGGDVIFNSEGENLDFKVLPQLTRLQYNLSLVCTTPSQFYLEVVPETIWLTKDNGFSEQVEVKSNVEWIIE